jgi:hypothetical protein
MHTELPVALHRQLQADSKLSLPDYDVLVQLTDTPEGRVRVLDLARALRWERSRLSHHIKRMEAWAWSGARTSPRTAAAPTSSSRPRAGRRSNRPPPPMC